MCLPPIGSIESGHAILFLGAGFSRQAKNAAGDSVIAGWELTKTLLKACGIMDFNDYDLETASQEYLIKFDEDSLIELLHSNFSISEVSEDQKRIVCQPWYRIYTTNYDDIVEKSNVGKSFVSKDMDSAIEKPNRNTTQLLHIYGAINRLTPNEFKKHFLLTERQRDQSPFLRSNWFRRFIDDVLAAKAVVFVGFSLADMDLRRLLGSLPPSSKEKIFFIDEVGCRRATQTRLSQYGSLALVGVAGFSSHLNIKRPGIPIINNITPPAFLRAVNFEIRQSCSVSAFDIQSLLIASSVNNVLIARDDIEGKQGSYTILRLGREIHRAVNRKDGFSPILIHSDIGNGKSVFMLQVAYAFALKGYKIFSLQKEPEDLSELLLFFQNQNEKCLLLESV